MIAITPTPTAVNVLIVSDTSTGIWDRLTRDPLGNALAIVVLLGMITALVGLIFYLHRNPGNDEMKWDWLIPILCVFGIVVAGYLTYVEVTQVDAVCGPVGDCNTVQQSRFARLFGILPIGLLGLSGYAAMGIAWSISRFGREQLSDLASMLLFGMCLFGVLFSIYLTFLEPFVIGASCAWCLTSAVLMTILLWLSATHAMQAFSRLQGN
jgi:uncharacterized membrane protein